MHFRLSTTSGNSVPLLIVFTVLFYLFLLQIMRAMIVLSPVKCKINITYGSVSLRNTQQPFSYPHAFCKCIHIVPNNVLQDNTHWKQFEHDKPTISSKSLVWLDSYLSPARIAYMRAVSKPGLYWHCGQTNDSRTHYDLQETSLAHDNQRIRKQTIYETQSIILV